MYSFYVSGKRIDELAHRTVYRSFVGEIPIGYEINHKDEDKHNNHLDNLEIVTRSENVRYGTAMQRRNDSHRKTALEKGSWNGLEKPCMNVDTGAKYPSVTEAAKQVNGKITSIANACAGTRKTYKKERWIYITKENYYASNP